MSSSKTNSPIARISMLAIGLLFLSAVCACREELTATEHNDRGSRALALENFEAATEQFDFALTLLKFEPESEQFARAKWGLHQSTLGAIRADLNYEYRHYDDTERAVDRFLDYAKSSDGLLTELELVEFSKRVLICGSIQNAARVLSYGLRITPESPPLLAQKVIIDAKRDAFFAEHTEDFDGGYHCLHPY